MRFRNTSRQQFGVRRSHGRDAAVGSTSHAYNIIMLDLRPLESQTRAQPTRNQMMVCIWGS